MSLNQTYEQFKCQWSECDRSATFYGLGRSSLMLCRVHFPEHLSQLQSALNDAVSDFHRAVDAIADANYRALHSEV